MDDPLLSTAPSTSSISLADMAGAPCERLYADTWQPRGAEYAGDVQATASGCASQTASGLPGRAREGQRRDAERLGSDYVRAECRDATLELDDRELTRYRYEADAEGAVGTTGREARRGGPRRTRVLVEHLAGRAVPRLAGRGDPMATNVDDNLQSVALVAAAIESSETDQPVAVQELLADARAAVDV